MSQKPKFGGKDATGLFKTEKQTESFASENVDTAMSGKKILKGVRAEIPDQVAVKITAPTGSEIKVSTPKRTRAPSSYTSIGTCKITGHVGVKVNADGISSKGNSRLKGRIRYQKMKCWEKHGPTLADAITKINDAGAIPSGEQAVIFDDLQYLNDLQRNVDLGVAFAAEYHAPTPRKKKVTPVAPEAPIVTPPLGE